MDLPYDVWHHISGYLPHYYVRGLLGVNHILFELVMDELYSTVEIRLLDDRTWWILFNLQNPMIASRVRCLRFSSCIADEFYFSWSRKYQGDTWMITAREAFDDVLTGPTTYWHHKITVHLDGGNKINMSLHDLMTVLINALPALPNLSEFEDIHSSQNSTPAYDMKPFYCAAFAAFGQKLQKLVLRRRLGSFSEVLKCVPHLPCLRELKITFVRGGSDDVEMQDTVEPFIARYRSTIQTLSLILLEVVNLSPLFLASGTWRALRKLEIHIPPDFTSWRNLSGFAPFIRRHMGSLRHLTWSLVKTGYPLRARSAQLTFGTWLRNKGVALSQLKTLCVRTVNHEDFLAILTQCRCSVNSLAILSVQGNPLSHEQVDSLVSIFSSPPARLINLKIVVKVLNPRLIYLLEKKLRGLKELTIYASRISPRSVTLFPYEMSAYFPHWHLYDIGIWLLDDASQTYRIERDFMYMLARFIPRVSGFWGKAYIDWTG